MTTPVGLSTPETAASTRSRTARLTAIEWRDSRFKPFTVAVVPEEGLPELGTELRDMPLTYREGRMLRLAAGAFEQVAALLPKSIARVPVIVGLPELHTTIPIKEQAFLQRLAMQVDGRIDVAQSSGIARGRAAALLGLDRAREMLEQGRAKFVVVGGVDSNVDLYVLGTLDMQKRVRTEVNSDGFAPGEGAGFVLLTTADAAREQKLEPIARIAAWAVATEPGHIYSEEPYRAEALAGAFQEAFAAAPGLPQVSRIYASFNGEHYWAKEFGVAVLRNKDRIASDYQIEHPAECFGDLGAAHGAVLLGIASFRAKQACPPAPSLVFSSSDYGDRAAVLLFGTGAAKS